MADIPVETSYVYELLPEGSDQWVQIFKIDKRYVYAYGLDNSEADIIARPETFDDLVVGDSVFANFLQLLDGDFLGYCDPGFVSLIGESHGE